MRTAATQGAEIALEDAVVLVDESTHQRDLPTAMAAVTTRRRTRITLVQDVSHAMLTAEMTVDAITLAEA